MSPASAPARGPRRFAPGAWLRRIACPAVAAAVCLGAVDARLVVVQANRAFSIADVHIRRGETLHFMNQDDFDHQIYVASPDFNFESDEAPPGSEVDLAFTQPGTFTVHCHIHPKMHLSVIVE